VWIKERRGKNANNQKFNDIQTDGTKSAIISFDIVINFTIENEFSEKTKI
jgi:hypothetical protein